MTNNLYVIACLTANSPNYRGKLHAMPYTGMEPVEVLTNKAMRMLDPKFPVAELVSDSLRHMGNRTLWAEVIWYRAQVAKIERIRIQREELQRWCYMVGLEMGFSQQRLQDARVVQRIIEDMVQDQQINQQQQVRQRGRHGCGHPA